MAKIFIDCGAHKGESVEHFGGKISDWVDYIKYCFEPNLELKKYFGNRKDVIYIPKIVWTKNSILAFYLSPNEGGGSSIYKNKTTGNLSANNYINVEAIDFNEWLIKNTKENDFIILKMDIEGAEYPVLNKLMDEDNLRRVNRLFVEFHWSRVGISRKMHLKTRRRLFRRGFRKIATRI